MSAPPRRGAQGLGATLLGQRRLEPVARDARKKAGEALLHAGEVVHFEQAKQAYALAQAALLVNQPATEHAPGQHFAHFAVGVTQGVIRAAPKVCSTTIVR